MPCPPYIPSLGAKQRKHGTGRVKFQNGKWHAYEPGQDRKSGKKIGTGFDFKHHAERALDDWLKLHADAPPHPSHTEE